MPIITIARLVAAGIAPTQARLFEAPLDAACVEFGITTAARAAAFIAQCRHESQGFTRLEEGLWYTTPERIRKMWPTRVPTLADAAKLCRNPQALANRVYAGRLGNGVEATGDGWAFRGRGLIQITGRANYRLAGYEAKPDAVAEPFAAARTAAWFFASNGCLPLADASNIDAITRIVNGPAMAAAAERRQNFQEAVVAFA